MSIPSAESSVGPKAYVICASAFAWVPAVFFSFVTIASAQFATGKNKAWGLAVIALFVLCILYLPVAIGAVLASGRRGRWLFAALNLIPLGLGLWWAALALIFGGRIYK